MLDELCVRMTDIFARIEMMHLYGNSDLLYLIIRQTLVFDIEGMRMKFTKMHGCGNDYFIVMALKKNKSEGKRIWSEAE